MQLIGVLIFICILVLLLGFAAYLAKSQKSRNDPYRSWSPLHSSQLSPLQECNFTGKDGVTPLHKISIYNSSQICYDLVCPGM